jgi:ubiquinone/menaquinone biosynthesis C-methylase UbiE
MSASRSIVWAHLAELPTFRALIRAIEHRLLAEHQPFAPPVLDVGCGDGHFGGAALGPRIDAGIDMQLAPLREAARRRVYQGLVRGSATELPFRAEAFATVVSNCAIEHIPRMPDALGEMHRVLQPGGRLLVTVPTNCLEGNLLIPSVLRRTGLRGWGERYTGWFRRLQVHYHLLTEAEWAQTLRDAGFRITHQRTYMSARATRVFEVAHYTGVPSLAARRLTGRWVVWPWRPRFVLTERLLAAFVDEPAHAGDSCLLIVAEKR